MSHHWTSSLDNHLDHSFVVFENVQLWFFFREMCVRKNLIYVWQIHLLSQHMISLGCAFGDATGFPKLVGVDLGTSWVVLSTSNHNTPQVKRRSTIHPPTSIQRNNFRFRGAVTNWGVLFAHPTDRYKCSTSKNAQNSTWCWFWVFKISYKIWVLKWPWSTLLCRVTHMTILAVTICMMNVRN